MNWWQIGLLAYGCGWFASVPFYCYVEGNIRPSSRPDLQALVAYALAALLWPVMATRHWLLLTRIIGGKSWR